MKALRPVPKPTRPERSTAAAKRYMARVAQLPCICCGRFAVVLHHPIHGRFSQSKASDLDVIPMCDQHHRDLHDRPRLWRATYGDDADYVAPVRKAVEAIAARTIGGRS